MANVAASTQTWGSEGLQPVYSADIASVTLFSELDGKAAPASVPFHLPAVFGNIFVVILFILPLNQHRKIGNHI